MIDKERVEKTYKEVMLERFMRDMEHSLVLREGHSHRENPLPMETAQHVDTGMLHHMWQMYWKAYNNELPTGNHHGSHETKEAEDKLSKRNIKDYQQETQWTCSAACLKSVLESYDHSVSEKECGVRIRVKKKNGAETTQIVDAAKSLGYEAFEKSFTIDEAKKLTDQGIPIICDIQSFTKPGAGHYVVLTDIKDDRAYLMDPNTEGNRRTLTIDEFSKRWWDREMKPPHKKMDKWGIVVIPK